MFIEFSSNSSFQLLFLEQVGTYSNITISILLPLLLSEPFLLYILLLCILKWLLI